MIKDHTKFWYLVFKYYPAHKFPDKETLLVYAMDSKIFPVEALNRAFEIYRKKPGNDHPPKPNSLIAIMDPLTTEQGVDDFANHLFEKVLGIGRYNNVREQMDAFENLVLDQSNGLCSAIFNCEHRPTVLKSIRGAINRARNPAKFTEMGRNGHLIGNEWKHIGETLGIDFKGHSGHQGSNE